MEKIASFEDFLNKAKELAEDQTKALDAAETMTDEARGNEEHYMFFQNLASIKHYIEEILAMEPDQVDDLLKNGHDWATDHIATAKTDIQQVAEFIRNEMEGGSEEGSEEEPEMIEPDNVQVDIEDDDADKKEESPEGEEEPAE
jgi:hypothetical protein